MTGGAGFIGSHIVDRLVREKVVVTVLDDFSGGTLANLKGAIASGSVTIVNGSINDPNLLRSALKDIDVVFHEAAIVSVQRSISEPELTHHVNIDGTKLMLDLSLHHGVKKFIFASSAAVYGNSATLPRSESTQLSPMSPYANSKLQGERLCQETQILYGLNTIALRYFNIYGSRSTSKLYSGVINAFAEQLLSNQMVTIFGDGKQSRDFINVEDIVNANILASAGETAGKIFNVGTGKETTILDLALIESRILLGPDRKPLIDFRPERLGDVKRSYADISLIRESLGFNPKTEFEHGLGNYLKSIYP